MLIMMASMQDKNFMFTRLRDRPMPPEKEAEETKIPTVTMMVYLMDSRFTRLDPHLVTGTQTMTHTQMV